MVKITRLPQTIRNLNRVYGILKVVARHGFGDVVTRLGLEGSWEWFKRKVGLAKGEPPETERLSIEEQIRRILEELGSTYVKLGQILATRPDLIPMSLVHELRKLQDDVPAFGTAEAKHMVEDELGAKVEEVFASFEEQPLAAASIAQVHRAVLKNGDDVVVKVQRPGLGRKIDADLDLLRTVAQLLEARIPELRRWQPVAIVDEFDKSIHKEIDFGREAHNIKKFARLFEGDPYVYAPRVYDDLSTDRVLTMEFIKGVKVNSDEIFKMDLDREAIAKTGIRAILSQIFVHGFFHADPHPGNVFVMEGNVVCLLDFGMMGTLDQERIDDLLQFLVCLLTNNPERMVRLFVKQGLIDETIDQRGLRADCSDLMDRYLGVEVAKIDVPAYIQQIFDVITRHRIILPSDLLLMGKSLATIDGIARDIYPELDPLSAIRPQILQIYFRRLADPEYYMRDTRRALEDTALLLQRLPSDLRLISEKLRNGTLTVRWEPTEAVFEKTLRERNRSSNRQAAAIAIVGLAAVSSFLLVATVEGDGFHSPHDAARVARLEESVAAEQQARRNLLRELVVARDASDAQAVIETERTLETNQETLDELRNEVVEARQDPLTLSGQVLFTIAVLGYLLSAFLGLGFFWGVFRSGGQ